MVKQKIRNILLLPTQSGSRSSGQIIRDIKPIFRYSS
nr:MAG TPA: hypothetical protein [Caudoviricetes sp.]